MDGSRPSTLESCVKHKQHKRITHHDSKVHYANCIKHNLHLIVSIVAHETTSHANCKQHSACYTNAKCTHLWIMTCNASCNQTHYIEKTLTLKTWNKNNKKDKVQENWDEENKCTKQL